MTDLYALRFDAAMREWERCANEPVVSVKDARCDVCLLVRSELVRRGHKAVCNDCRQNKEMVSIAPQNSRPSVPPGDAAFEERP
jgi:hypothetical protein